MRPYQITIIMIFVVLSLSVAASAQEIGSPRENVCNEGGLLFRDGVSLCETDWHWECGWYIAHWQNTAALVPDWCGTGHLAVAVAPSDDGTPPVHPGCVPVYYDISLELFSPESDYYYANFGSQFILSRPLTLYDVGCQNALSVFSMTLVYASSATEALDLCLTIPEAYDVSHDAAYPNIYTCIFPIIHA